MKCKITKKSVTPFMSFGKMPIANGFLERKDFNKEYYFNPVESVGLGSATPVGAAGTVVGSGSTVTFSNPGNGMHTTRYVPAQTIYIPGHKLETGDKITYGKYAGQKLSVNGVKLLLLNDDEITSILPEGSEVGAYVE